MHVDKMMQSIYLSVILHFEHKKIPILAVFTWFLILGKKQPRPQEFSLKKWVREKPWGWGWVKR